MVRLHATLAHGCITSVLSVRERKANIIAPGGQRANPPWARGAPGTRRPWRGWKRVLTPFFEGDDLDGGDAADTDGAGTGE
jgi:hypothetical protein